MRYIKSHVSEDKVNVLATSSKGLAKDMTTEADIELIEDYNEIIKLLSAESTQKDIHSYKLYIFNEGQTINDVIRSKIKNDYFTKNKIKKRKEKEAAEEEEKRIKAEEQKKEEEEKRKIYKIDENNDNDNEYIKFIKKNIK